MPIPWLTVQEGTEPTPLEGQGVPESTGLLANFKSAFYGSLGASLIAQGVGAAEGGPDVSHDDAARQFKANGYDPGILPAGDVTKGSMAALMNQQDKIQANQDLARRAHLGGVSEFLTSMAGSLSDPVFLALAPVAGEADVMRGLSLAGRAAKGAVIGGGIMGGYTAAEHAFGTAPGDEDISTADILRQTALGALLGAPVEAAFGARPRPSVPDLQDTAKVAVMQTTEDSPVNVEPILDRQSPAAPVTSEMADAVPKPDTILAQDPATQMLGQRIEESTAKGEVSLEASDLNEQAAQATKDAQHAESIIEPEAAPFTGETKDTDAAIANDDTLAKAIDAAVRCGALRGFG